MREAIANPTARIMHESIDMLEIIKTNLINLQIYIIFGYFFSSEKHCKILSENISNDSDATFPEIRKRKKKIGFFFIFYFSYNMTISTQYSIKQRNNV